MKTILKTVFAFMFVLLVASCNSGENKDTNAKADAPTKQINKKEKGQAFIKDDGATPTVLQLAI
jgi:uncharacterized lipoprotein